MMTETTIAARIGFSGRLLKIEVLDVELPDGSRSVREIVRHPGAAVILCRLPDGRFVFVRQFRKPLEREVCEVVAGTLEKDENPEACAIREVREETGYRVARLHKLGVTFPAPGYTDELHHIFFAELDADRGEMCPDEDEKLDVLLLAEEDIETMINDGRLGDGKTLAAWLLYERMKARLIDQDEHVRETK